MIFQTAAKCRSAITSPSPILSFGSQGKWVSGESGPGEAGPYESFLELYFVLNGNLHYQMKDLGDQHLSAGQYNIIYPPLLQTRPWLEQDHGNIAIFNIHFSTSYLQNWILPFPALTPLLEKARKRIACTFSETPAMAGPEMISLIRNILDCPYTGDLRTIYLELQASSLLTIILARPGGSSTKKRTGLLLTPQDIEKIEATRQYLLQNMDHPPTLVALAHKIGLNDFKLKKGYKQLYGNTLFVDFLHARMERARQLLTRTDQSIVGIAEAAGYKNVSGFSAAFKRYFGHTPGHLRKTN
jgi:AraC family transcriptional regulator, transcriptional activator of the genes for pyochelin and ferripyochelin receptors